MKLVVVLLLFLGFAYQLTLTLVQYRSAKNPIPQNVADVYDGETYAAWRRYSAEHCRLDIFSAVLSFLMSLALLCTHAYAAFASLFGGHPYAQLLAVVLLETVVGAAR